jgi:hypothetical protein
MITLVQKALYRTALRCTSQVLTCVRPVSSIKSRGCSVKTTGYVAPKREGPAQTKTDMVWAEDVGTRCRVFFVLLARAGGCKHPKPSQKWVDAVPEPRKRPRTPAIHQLDSVRRTRG